MRLLIITLLLLSSTVFASQKNRLYRLYNQGKYEAVCEQGFKNFQKHRHDETYISLYAYGCLNSDSIDRLATPIVMLKYSKDARANASYFAAILMKKKLLYHALLDGYDLSGIQLPASSYILSKVFDLFIVNKNKPVDNIYMLNDPADKSIHFTLYIDKSERIPKMILEEYKSNILIKRHTYW